VTEARPFVALPDLVADLRALGMGEGQTLMVHSSLRSIGYVLGGAATVVRALVAALGDRGTLVMPAFSPEVSDPAGWSKPALQAAWIERARAQVPAYDADTTPTSMGAIPETFRRWPGVRRGPHPQVSICAHGPRAAEIVAPHAPAWGEGAGSPFERLAEMDAGLLLLGVGFNRAALLHYAESLVPHGRRKVRRVPVGDGAERSWVEAPDVGDDLDTQFPAIGAAFLAEGRARQGRVGGAEAVLASARDLAAFASAYLARALDRPA
jgi:aminoglycoside 3-N-acetyltransferase